jgi:CRISPR-associated endonuclease Cas2
MNGNWLIIYDIRDQKRLAKTAKIMTGYATRVQKSVFEFSGEERIINIIKKRVKRHVEEEDYIVYFKICERDWQNRQKHGVGKFIEHNQEDFMLV